MIHNIHIDFWKIMGLFWKLLVFKAQMIIVLKYQSSLSNSYFVTMKSLFFFFFWGIAIINEIVKVINDNPTGGDYEIYMNELPKILKVNVYLIYIGFIDESIIFTQLCNNWWKKSSKQPKPYYSGYFQAPQNECLRQLGFTRLLLVVITENVFYFCL